MSNRRLDVREAAEALGVSVDAVRMRVRRGTLVSEKDQEGRVWIWVDTDESPPNTDATETSQETSRELIEQLRSENAYLREQLGQEREANRENRRLLAAALERIPALESGEGSEDQPSPPASESPDPEPGSPASSGESRSWWRRWF